MSDGTIQIAQPGTGQFIDTSQLTNDEAFTVQRQRIAIADPITMDFLALVDKFGRLNVAGQNIAAAHTYPTIAASSTTLLAANTSAKYRFIQNTTATPAYIDLSGAAAVVGQCMFIGPYGSFEMSAGNGNMITGIIHAISTSGSILFVTTEGT